MKPTRLIILTAGIAALGGCGDSARVVAPTAVELWLPEVVASPEEIEGVAGAAVDPLMAEITAQLPDARYSTVWSALHDFEAGLDTEPASSFATLEARLDPLDEDEIGEDDPDAQLADDAIDLYRDWASQTLFGMDRATFGEQLVKQGG